MFSVTDSTVSLLQFGTNRNHITKNDMFSIQITQVDIADTNLIECDWQIMEH